MNVSKMTIKLLKQELTKRGLPTDGLKPALVARLELALWKNSNEAFHFCTKHIKDTAAGIASAEGDVAALEDQLAEIQAELDAARHRIPVLKREQSAAQRELQEREPGLFFAEIAGLRAALGRGSAGEEDR